jgi:protein phosphatase
MNTEPITPTVDRVPPGPRPETYSEVGGLAIVHASATHIGYVREDNEDRLLARAGRVFVVADGMGGPEGGEIAAELVRTMFVDLFDALRTEPEGALEDLAEVIRSANSAIYERNVLRKAEDPKRRSMGATCTACMVLASSQLAIAHVGDSRLYRLRDRRLVQLTADHNAITIVGGQPVVHANILDRAVGTTAELEVDADLVDIEVGDVLLLCSDGLYGAVSDRAIAATLLIHPPGRAVAELVQMALAAGGEDNITAIVVRVEGA